MTRVKEDQARDGIATAGTDARARQGQPVDYSAEAHLHSSSALRGLLWTAGTLSLGAGIAGIFLPLLPTTPFLLLAAACYARSSVRFYNWLLNQRWLGPYIRQWRHSRSVPLRAKLLAIAMIVLTIGTSVIFFIPVPLVKWVVVAIGLAVIGYLLQLPSSPRPERANEEPGRGSQRKGGQPE